MKLFSHGEIKSTSQKRINEDSLVFISSKKITQKKTDFAIIFYKQHRKCCPKKEKTKMENPSYRNNSIAALINILMIVDDLLAELRDDKPQVGRP